MRRLLFLLFFCTAAFAQGTRVDIPQIVGGTGRPIPNVQVTVCTGTATGLPCSPQVLTYTDATLTTACSAGFQVTLTNTNICQATSDSLGNAGFWVPSGSVYKYTLTGPNITGQTYIITPGVFGALAAGSGTVTNAGVFTNTQMNEYVQSLINGCSPVTEFHRNGSIGFNTDAIAGCIASPNTSTVANNNALAGYVNISSTTGSGVGLFTQSNCLASGTHCWGANPNVSDGATQTGTFINGIETDVGVNNTSTSGSGLLLQGVFFAQPPNAGALPAVNISTTIGTGKWTSGILFQVGSVLSGDAIVLQQQASGNSQASQLIQFNSKTSGGATDTAQIFEDAFGNFALQNGGQNTLFTPAGGLDLSGPLMITEGTAPSGNATNDILYADSTAHRWKMNNNNGGALTVAATSGDTFTSTTLTSPTINGTTSLGRVTYVAAAPASCTVTGAGASGSCAFGTGSTDIGGVITITVGGAGPAASGTLTITPSASLGTNFYFCQFAPLQSSTLWNVRATMFQNNAANTSAVMAWDNNGVALVAPNSMNLTYMCHGQ